MQRATGKKQFIGIDPSRLSAKQTDEREKRRVERLPMIDSEIPSTPVGTPPTMMLVAPTDLVIDGAYQRNLGRRSLTLIAGMVRGFSWAHFKPPIVTRVDGELHCVDGQHTAIAAATRRVPKIPVFVVDAAEEVDRARAFVAHNQDRVIMDPLDLYRARVAARDPDALATEEVRKKAGLRFRIVTPSSKPKPGDIQSASCIEKLVKRQGEAKAVNILKALVKGERYGIMAAEVQAAESFLTQKRTDASPSDLAKVILAIGERGVAEARMRASLEKRPHRDVLLDDYVRTYDRQQRVL